MLSTNIFLLSNKQIQIMRPTHANHPCTMWARQTRSNAEWLMAHMEALCAEYTARYGKVHAVETKYLPALKAHMPLIPQGELLPFANCATNHKHIENVFEAYRMEMQHKWLTDKRVPTWYREKRNVR